MPRNAFRLVPFLLLTPITCFATDPCDEAYDNGKDTENFVRCRSEAQAGNAEAEFGYALILWSGHDRANDQREALKWFHRSARQGHKLAQVSLGMFLSREEIDHAFRNRPEAYAWFVTAGETEAANRLLSQLTPSEAQTAKILAKEYQAKYKK
jgi:TPR repeat protein